LGPKITEEQLPSELVYGDFEQFSTTEGGKDLRSRTESQERQIIVETLEKTRYNKSKAAELLKIDRKTLYNKIRQYGINN
jgi:two-component system response regulator HydG